MLHVDLMPERRALTPASEGVGYTHPSSSDCSTDEVKNQPWRPGPSCEDVSRLQTGPDSPPLPLVTNSE